MKIFILFSLLFSILTGCSAPEKDQDVLTGADRLLGEEFSLIKDKNVGIVTNHTALLSNGIHLVDTLHNRADVTVKVLFGPEHGIRGDEPDGMKIKDGIDSKTGVPVYSLYGKIRKPTPEMLKDVDVLIFDIQDIGARFYTFISTMYYTLQAAAENDIPVLVLDRPNPIGGLTVDGPIRVEELKSFVAIAPVAIVHGMTVGELATIFNDENMLEDKAEADLTVVEMKNWEREMYYDQTGLNWVAPSPNMPDLETALLYPGLCLIEGTNISEGRGTLQPFKQIGAPFINKDVLSAELNKLGIEGLKITPVKYTPVSIENMSKYPKFQDKTCYGVKLEITDRDKFESLKFGVRLVSLIRQLYPDQFEFRKNWLDKLTGVEWIRDDIKNGADAIIIISKWKEEVDTFKNMRESYLRY
ncbi:MAG: hypothetical protein SCALA702_36150 [Melioribacteraceae bacterium]|nr:MAG: hypothetical protein SCALA702_36150 [Melioribacteraceae bacterium]